MAAHAADSTLLGALLGGASAADAAAQAGISERTACRRLADPAFRAALVDAQHEQRARVVDALGAAATQAVATLVELLAPGFPPTVRHAAARSVLELGLRLHEEQELEARLAALEATQANPP
jgi:hypothetical protein